MPYETETHIVISIKRELHAELKKRQSRLRLRTIGDTLEMLLRQVETEELRVVSVEK